MIVILGSTLLFLFCNRDNPFDVKSGNYISGKRPHVFFNADTISGYLQDTISISLSISDTGIGGIKGRVKKVYFSWNNDSAFFDSADGTDKDTMIVTREFPIKSAVLKVIATDFDGNVSDADSARLIIKSSRPQIISTNTPVQAQKALPFSLSVLATDVGGTIKSYLWAQNGKDFLDTTPTGTFQTQFNDTGEKTILVKMIDNKNVVSGIDTIHCIVFEKLFSISYDGNGNSGGSVPIDSNKYGQGQSVAVIGNSGNLVKNGFTFVGWNTQANGSGAYYVTGAKLPVGTDNVVLYAQWTVNVTYTVTYDGNGNLSGTVPSDTAHYELGQTVTVLGNSGSLAKAGNTFVGWNTQANGGGISYAIGVAFTMGSSNTTLYAQWTADPTFWVTYDGNGNTGGTVPIDNNNYIANAIVTVLGNTSSLAKTGFTFVGWNTQANGTGTAYAAGVTFAIGTANTVLYAQWTANPTFTVTYNGNGNTGGNVPADVNSYAQGQAVTTRNVGSLVKSGSTFTGWNTAANGSGTGYAEGATFPMGSSNVTLFAQWTANPTFTVTYIGNNNTAGTPPSDTAHYLLGQSVTVLSNTGALTKTGNTFIGWNTQANGSGINYAAGISFTMGSSNVTLYAQWTANSTFTVSYDGNGNTGGLVPIDNNNYATGATVTVLSNTGSLVKTGFTFVGWNTKTNGSGTSYAAGVTFSIGSANTILYAQWTANPTFSVTYNGNGNTGGSVGTDVNNYTTGSTVTVLNPGSLAKTGYSFTNWNTQANGGGTSYAVGSTFAMGSANVVLYAQWTVISTYTVTYNGNGNTGGTIPSDTSHYSLGQNVVTRNNTGVLVKTGFTLIGWNTAADGSGISYASGVTFTMGSANVTLYAKWTANPTFTVTYDGNGNTGGTVPADNNNYTVGASVSVSSNTGTLSKTGFTFVGWNTKTNGSGTSYAAGVTFAMGSANVILYAQWTANSTYIVTYNGNGNTGGTVLTDINNYLSGSIVTVLNPGSLVRTGYSFASWNTQANGGGTSYAVGSTFTMGSTNVVLYAQWAIISTYTVTYNGNGNTGGTIPSDTAHYVLGQGVIASSNTGALAKSGFTFSGWNTAADGSGISYAAGASFTMGSSNVTLFAKWTALPTFTVSYDGNGNTGGSIPTDTNNYIAGRSVTAALNSGNLVKSGFTFVGWNTKTNGSGTSYAAGATFTMGSANLILYAQWTANPTFTMTYNKNGSTGGSVPVDPNNYLAGASVVVRGNTGNLSRTGYSFAGWDTAAAGNGTLFIAGSTFVLGNANETLYARWNLIPTYTVSYNANGGSGNVPTDNGHYTTGQTAAVLGNTGGLAKSGFAFAGWNTASDGSGVSYTSGSVLVIGTSNVILYAQWNQTYTVIYNSTTATSGNVPVDNARYATGQSVVVLGNTGNLARSGYTFMGWNTQSGGNGAGYNAGATFTMGTANVILYAQWTAVPTATIIATAGSHGSISPAGSVSVVIGTNQTFTISPAANYHISDVQVDGVSQGQVTTYTFTNVTASHAISATFAINTFTITASAGSNGSISPNGSVVVNAATAQAFTMTPAANYHVADVLVDGISQGSVSTFNFTNVTANHTISATFAINTFTITASAGSNGSISPNGSVVVNAATSQTFTLTPAANYHIADVLVDGNSQGTVSTFTFSNITANHTISATFAVNTFTISASAGANGSISPSGSVVVNAATSQAFTITPAANYHVADVLVDGVSQGAITAFNFTSITANHSISATFAVNTFTISASAGANGSISPSGSVVVNAAASQTFTITPASNYHVAEVLVDGVSQGAVTTYSFTNISVNHTIAVSFAANFTVTYNGNNNTGGTAPVDPNTYAPGQNATVLDSGTLVNTGFNFSGWNTDPLGAGTTYATGNSLPIGTSNITLYAIWKP